MVTAINLLVSQKQLLLDLQFELINAHFQFETQWDIFDGFYAQIGFSLLLECIRHYFYPSSHNSTKRVIKFKMSIKNFYYSVDQ